MRGFLIFLLLIPAIAALGHDAYLFYNNHLNPGVFSIDLLLQEFKFSALGFIWTNYEVESYKMTVQSMSEDDWALIDYMLTFKAFYVGLGFAAFFIIFFAILALFGIGPFSAEKSGGIQSRRR